MVINTRRTCRTIQTEKTEKINWMLLRSKTDVHNDRIFLNKMENKKQKAQKPAATRNKFLNTKKLSGMKRKHFEYPRGASQLCFTWTSIKINNQMMEKGLKTKPEPFYFLLSIWTETRMNPTTCYVGQEHWIDTKIRELKSSKQLLLGLY